MYSLKSHKLTMYKYCNSHIFFLSCIINAVAKLSKVLTFPVMDKDGMQKITHGSTSISNPRG